MSDPDPFIPGIFNYCDRWCERCPFTGRCRLYAMEQESLQDAESRDPDNEKFWQSMKGIFERTKEMLYDIADREGIDLDAAVAEMDPNEVRQELEELQKHPLVTHATEYWMAADRWFKDHEGAFKRKGEDLGQAVLIDLPATDPEAEVQLLQDAVEVLRWYQIQIAPKLVGALSMAQDEELYEGQLDSDGTAKVALLGIDRSLAAWGVLYEQLEAVSDTILPMMVSLDKLRRAVEHAFPGARAFVRPGFDTRA